MYLHDIYKPSKSSFNLKFEDTAANFNFNNCNNSNFNNNISFNLTGRELRTNRSGFFFGKKNHGTKEMNREVKIVSEQKSFSSTKTNFLKNLISQKREKIDNPNFTTNNLNEVFRNSLSITTIDKFNRKFEKTFKEDSTVLHSKIDRDFSGVVYAKKETASENLENLQREIENAKVKETLFPKKNPKYSRSLPKLTKKAERTRLDCTSMNESFNVSNHFEVKENKESNSQMNSSFMSIVSMNNKRDLNINSNISPNTTRNNYSYNFSKLCLSQQLKLDEILNPNYVLKQVYENEITKQMDEYKKKVYATVKSNMKIDDVVRFRHLIRKNNDLKSHEKRLTQILKFSTKNFNPPEIFRDKAYQNEEEPKKPVFSKQRNQRVSSWSMSNNEQQTESSVNAKVIPAISKTKSTSLFK